MIVRDVLFWMWLGGVLGFGFELVNGPHTIAVMQRSRHTLTSIPKRWHRFLFSIGVYGVALLTILTWPLTLVVRFTIGGWLKSLIGRKLAFGDARCAVCGFTGEYTSPRGNSRWVAPPGDWFLNRDFDLVCSPACAQHFDRCPHDNPQTHLH